MGAGSEGLSWTTSVSLPTLLLLHTVESSSGNFRAEAPGGVSTISHIVPPLYEGPTAAVCRPCLWSPGPSGISSPLQAGLLSGTGRAWASCLRGRPGQAETDGCMSGCKVCNWLLSTHRDILVYTLGEITPRVFSCLPCTHRPPCIVSFPSVCMASTSTGPVLWAPSYMDPTPDHSLLWPLLSYLGNGISRTSAPPGGSRDTCPQMSFDSCGGAGDGLARNSWSRGPKRPTRPTPPLRSKEGDEGDLPT